MRLYRILVPLFIIAGLTVALIDVMMGTHKELEDNEGGPNGPIYLQPPRRQA